MRDEFRTPVDDEIDHVARAMTAAAPSAALRSAVRARITRSSRVHHAARWSVGIVAGAAVIVLAIVWPDRDAFVDVPALSPAVVTVASPPAIDPQIESGPARRGRVAERTSPDNQLPLQVDILELPLLELDPLDVPLLALEAWDVEPLALQQ